MTEVMAAYDGEGIMIGRKIVRCKDCQHGCYDGNYCNYFGYWEHDNLIPATVTPDGFCAWGINKE